MTPRWCWVASSLLCASLWSGCHNDDPCSGHNGTCLGLEIDGSGISSVDQLRFSVAVAGRMQLLTAETPPVPGKPVSLPTQTAIYFAQDVAGSAQIGVDGELDGAVVATGATSVTLTPGRHVRAIVTLASSHNDGAANDFASAVDLTAGNVDQGGVDTGAFDLPAPDLFGVDLFGVDLVTPPDLGPVAPCPGNALFCDDFEGEVGFSRWTNTFGGGAKVNAQLDNTHPFLHGSSSLEVDSAGNGFALKESLPSPSAAPSTLAVRFYYYASGTTGAGANYLRVTDDASTSVLLGVTPSGSPDWQVGTGTFAFSGGSFTAGEWRCVELDLDLTKTTFYLYDNSAASPNPTAAPILTGSLPLAGSYNTIYLGVYTPPTTGESDLWFDDVVVATSHIGCE